ncbi:c-type cytochrome [Roseovarius nitratireducens]|uniref:c-type cytochrome n=1 Tax=Roseovarius nitratireducens TaxID=2044597 RepID=UPI000CE17275|nr:cytochrome c family protein [Roseovarius nitratireducens]
MKKKLVTAILALAVAAPAWAEGDPEAGEKVFRKCKACHMVGEGAKNRVGPALNGVVGGPVASVEGFKYSDVFQEMAAEGAVWTEEELAAFLDSPRKYAKGTKMAFPGLRKKEEIADVIAYLATFE